MSQPILIIAENKGAALRRVTLEAISAASQLLEHQADRIHCFLTGTYSQEELQQISTQLGSYNVGKLFVVPDSEQNNFGAVQLLPFLQKLVEQLQPSYVIAGHTALGRELAPRLAAGSNGGYIADITKIVGPTLEDNNVTFIRPIYAGKAFESRQFTGNASRIITIRPNNHPIMEATSERNADIIVLPSPPSSLRAIIKDTITRIQSSVDLTEANVIVAGGRGVRGSEGFQLLQELAHQLNGAVGASRAACDAGYCDYSLQIGQTGKVVTPELYIACGISGAIQHLAGMNQSRTIIAINKDAEAPIFSIADYGIVGDLFDIVPLLIHELNVLKK